METVPPDTEAAGQTQTLSVTDMEGAKICKQASYEIYKELNELYQTAKEENAPSVAVSLEALRAMRGHAKSINRGITQFTRSVGYEMFRLGLEQSVLKSEMHGDILDREAAFTETLEAIGTEKDGSVSASLAAALKVVQSSHAAILSLKEDTVFESESVEECARLRDAAS